MVELVGVRKRYRRTGVVLAEVDVVVVPGAPVVVVGANGSGKSTLLRIAAGCSAPSAGRVVGRPPTVGYVPAPFPASSRLSVRSYLRHMAAIHGHGAEADVGEGLLEELGFTGVLDGPVAELSTGNAQKVGLAQALSGSAALVVLDEPWSGLDVAAADALERRLGQVASSVAVLIADHSGRGLALPGVDGRQLHRGTLHRGSLHPGRTEPPTAPVGPGVEVMIVELWCPAPVPETLDQLPPGFTITRSDPPHPAVTVELVAGRGDALLAAAIGVGCSVLSVSRRAPR